MEFQIRYLALFRIFSVIDGITWFWMGIFLKNIQLIAIYVDDTILCSKCEQTSDSWQQLKMAFELESDLQEFLDWGRKWLVDYNAEKTQLASFHRSHNPGAIDVEMAGSILEKKKSFKLLGLSLFSKLDCSCYIISIVKTAIKAIGALIRSIKFLSPEVALYLYKSIS